MIKEVGSDESERILISRKNYISIGGLSSASNYTVQVQVS